MPFMKSFSLRNEKEFSLIRARNKEAKIALNQLYTRTKLINSMNSTQVFETQRR